MKKEYCTVWAFGSAALFRLRPWRLNLVKHSVCQLLSSVKLNIYLIDFIGVYFEFWGNVCGKMGAWGCRRLLG